MNHVPGHGGREITVTTNGERVWITQPIWMDHAVIDITIAHAPELARLIMEAVNGEHHATRPPDRHP
jgi:hypothetical protein